MNLLSLLLKGMTTASSISALSKKTGISAKTIKKFLPLVLPILLKAMTSNASSSSGAQSLLGALTQHTNKKPLEDQISNADEKDGAAIIGHILGGNAAAVTNELSSETGISSNEVNLLMSLIAPAMLSSLSAANTTAQQAQAAQSGKKPGKKPGAAKPGAAKPGADAEVLTLGGQQSGGGFMDFLQMFGAAQEPEVQESTSSSASLLQTLLGGKDDVQQNSNGSALLNLLLKSAK